jgi:L-amino acid N-acyltransferase YncA
MNPFSFKPFDEKYLEEATATMNYYVLNTTCSFFLKPISVDDMRKMLVVSSDKYQTFSVFFEEKWAGYFLIKPYNIREAYNITAEVSIYLKPDFTCKGIGKNAFQFLETFAIQKGFHSLVSIVSGENTGSIRLCNKMGYQQCGQLREVGEKFGRKIDILYFQKMLE